MSGCIRPIARQPRPFTRFLKCAAQVSPKPARTSVFVEVEAERCAGALFVGGERERAVLVCAQILLHALVHQLQTIETPSRLNNAQREVAHAARGAPRHATEHRL
eukprot:2803043-Pyramimonas_sp.AAC.1